MDAKELAKYVDHERWLLNSGMASESAKNQLFMYGSIVHADVRALELTLDAAKRRVNYVIYLDRRLIKKHEKYMELSKSEGLFGLWRFRRMLKKEGNLNFKHLLGNFVKDFCGPKWSVDLKIADYADYTDGFGDEDNEEAAGPITDFKSDKRSD